VRANTATNKETARAKINLTLHVGAAQEDEFHPLHSLVVFAHIGDELSLQMSKTETAPRLNISGPFADNLPNGADNLIMQAYGKFSTRRDAKPVFNLVKNLPIASGIGGGSADAAATIRLMSNHDQNLRPSPKTLSDLGADIPACLLSKTCLMEGIGERLTPLPDLGQVAALLVNPGVSISTAAVFKTFDKTGSSSQFHLPPSSLLEMAQGGHNDLQETAISIEPVIHTVLESITAQEGCQLARMSGSGATCFGVFPDIEDAQNAAKDIKAKYADWWCMPTMLGDTP